MRFEKSNHIMTHKVLNEDTGELESKDYKELKEISHLRGGFNLIYHKTYEEVTESAVKSNTDMKLFNWITNQFTYQKVDVPLYYNDCTIKISQPQFSRIIKRLIELDYLKRTNRGIYRLNPFIYLPYKANGSELQKEWKILNET